MKFAAVFLKEVRMCFCEFLGIGRFGGAVQANDRSICLPKERNTEGGRCTTDN